MTKFDTRKMDELEQLESWKLTLRATGNAIMYCKSASLIGASPEELSTAATTCLAKSFAAAITLVQAFLPSSNREYDASVRNTSSSANAGAVS